jgi:aryl-alcohol dehydrogenase-like predicted oxidoreductase
MAVPRTLQFAGREVLRIGLGTNRLTPEHAGFAREMLAAGVQHVDTAHVYQQGGSETALGEAGAAAAPGVVLATKGGMGEGNGRREVLREQVEESLGRLRAESIALYYLHRVYPDVPFEETIGGLAELRAEGKIRHVGLSQVGIDLIEQARAIVPVAAVQNHYNLAERGGEGVVDYCEANGIVFVPFYPLRDLGSGPVEEIAGRHGSTPQQVALAWLLRRSPAMLPIPGTLSLDHLKENLAALDLELSDEEFAALS